MRRLFQIREGTVPSLRARDIQVPKKGQGVSSVTRRGSRGSPGSRVPPNGSESSGG